MQLPTHELKDNLVLLSAVGSTIAAIVMPWLLNRDTKRTMAVSWGKFTEKVDAHGQRLDKAEATIEAHTGEIGYLKGRANGAAIH
jgi:hypothetical protein